MLQQYSFKQPNRENTHMWWSFNVTQHKLCVVVVIEHSGEVQSLHSVLVAALTSASINVSCFKATLIDFLEHSGSAKQSENTTLTYC